MKINQAHLRAVRRIDGLLDELCSALVAARKLGLSVELHENAAWTDGDRGICVPTVGAKITSTLLQTRRVSGWTLKKEKNEDNDDGEMGGA